MGLCILFPWLITHSRRTRFVVIVSSQRTRAGDGEETRNQVVEERPAADHAPRKRSAMRR